MYVQLANSEKFRTPLSENGVILINKLIKIHKISKIPPFLFQILYIIIFYIFYIIDCGCSEIFNLSCHYLFYKYKKNLLVNILVDLNLFNI